MSWSIANEEGYKARKEGKSELMNPYKGIDQEKFEEWLEGYTDAHFEAFDI